MILFTRKCHFNYIIKVLYEYGENRLPKKLAAKIIEEKIDWFQEWLILGQRYELSWDNWIDSEALWKYNCQLILQKETELNVQESILRARQTSNHGMYNKLNYVSGVEYLDSQLSAHSMGIILKARGGLIHLNGNSYNTDQIKQCSLCNLREEETFFHFFGVCPVFKELRLMYFGINLFADDRMIAILNGENWEKLAKYIKVAQNYRLSLIQEFNL